jgi:PKD repeat protein
MVWLQLLACSCASTDDGIVLLDSDPPEETEQDSPVETATDSPVDTGPFPSAVANANPEAGNPPLTVDFDAEGSTVPSGELQGSWVVDGVSLDGLDVSVEFSDPGSYLATLTVTDGEHTAEDSITVYVRDADCPTWEHVVWGQVTANQLNEVSGVVQSRQDPAVLWVHNDAGDDPNIYALRQDGRLLGTWTLTGAPNGDIEDIAIGQDDDGHILYVGDVGDNASTREFIRVYRVVEPAVDTEPVEPVELEVDAVTMILRYPEEASYNSETLFIDPPTQDLYIVTKDYGGQQKLFRKPPPHAPGDSTLEFVLDLNFGMAPLGGGATTGGDISLDGSLIIVRTYDDDAWLWRRDENETVGQAMAEIPCMVQLPIEPQPESVGFSTDGLGLITISERAEPMVNYTLLK